MNASPITAAKATEIRAMFAAKANDARALLITLTESGDTNMAGMLAKQIKSYDDMAARQYESMTVAATIS